MKLSTPDLGHAFDHLVEGTPIGTSPWMRLPQILLTQFEVLTKSNDPLHMDPDWVKVHTPYPGTIAPGFLTLSLLPHFVNEIKPLPEGYVSMNYGFDRLRWVEPIPVDSNIRAHLTSAGVRKRKGHEGEFLFSVDLSIEIQGNERPGMVARWLAIVIKADSFAKVALQATT